MLRLKIFFVLILVLVFSGCANTARIETLEKNSILQGEQLKALEEKLKQTNQDWEHTQERIKTLGANLKEAQERLKNTEGRAVLAEKQAEEAKKATEEAKKTAETVANEQSRFKDILRQYINGPENDRKVTPNQK